MKSVIIDGFTSVPEYIVDKEDEIMEEAEKMKDVERKGMPLKKTTKESLEETLREAKQELEIAKNLKAAIIKYIGIYDVFADENTDGFCLILGRLEMSIIQRRQMLIDDTREWMELKEVV